jgi:uncharacterized protein (TIGR00251 family)
MYEDTFDVGEDGSVTLFVHAQPGAGRSAMVGRYGDAIKIRIAAPPEGGRANEALAKLIAETVGVKAADVTLVSGDKSRSKRFRIVGADADELPKLLERAVEIGAGVPAGGRVQDPRARRPH